MNSKTNHTSTNYGISINQSITICGEKIYPGDKKLIEITSTNLFTHTSMSIPVHVIRGKKAGPCLLVTAAIHGDELNGIEIVKRLIKLKKLNKLRGTLIAVPIMNVFGFIHLSRYLPDRRDLNRSFPGSNKGSLAARLAEIFTRELVSKSTHIIDLHTGTKHRFNLPQIRGDLNHPATLGLAKAFAAPVIIHANLRDGSLRSIGTRKKIPSLAYEAGEALRFDSLSISLGIKGIINVMQHIGMLPSVKFNERSTPAIMAKATQWMRAPQSGIFYPKKKLGQQVTKDETIGKISDPLGQKETKVYASQQGIIIGQFNLPLVTEGDALFNIAYFDEPYKKERNIIKNSDEDAYFDERGY